MTPHPNRLAETAQMSRLDETVQMRGHNIRLYAEVTKISLIITQYSLLSRALHTGEQLNIDGANVLFQISRRCIY